MKIVIVGGGLGGFAVGIGLLQHGYTDITVYERDTGMDSRRQGYGLTILQGISALKRLQVFQQVHSLDTPSRSHYIFDKYGSMIGFFGTVFWPEQDNQLKSRKKHNLHIERQELRRILMNKYISLHPLGAEGIQWDHRIVQIDRDSHKVSFTNDLTVTGVDLVIGADGINGIVRSFKYDPLVDIPLNYLNILVVLGITGCIEHFLTKDRVFQTMDGCFRLFAMPFSKSRPEQSIMWQLSFPVGLTIATQLSRDPMALKQMLLEKCGDWHSPIPEMIERTSLDLLMGIPAFDRDLVPIPDSKNDGLPIALLGDAAHPMSPFKGQGANQALLDAVDLSDIIAQNNQDFHSTINQYEDQMLKRVYTKVMQSRERVTSFHRPEALATENFEYRGVDKELIERLNSLGINAHWNDPNISVEQAIIDNLNVT
jgi:2-polyprenyl-6-methoxyphenol hydroxylase-like FAD-dependent oxidoreductase